MNMHIVNFFELSEVFTLKPQQAIDYFQNKGLKVSFSWLDMLAEENDAAFTVAKMMDTDLLSFVDRQVDRMLDEGETLATFKQSLIPRLQQAGWWGRRDLVDPLTCKVTKAKLGSASRLENIFRTNLQSAYAVGQWQSIQTNKASAPFLMYDAVDDHRTRSEHRQWNGTVRPVDDPFWKTHYPPNGWNCRCGVIQLTRQELKQHGLPIAPKPKIKRRTWINPRTGKARNVPVDLDPGWDHNAGERRLAHLQQVSREKTSQLTTDQQKAIRESEQAVKQARQKMYQNTKTALKQPENDDRRNF